MLNEEKFSLNDEIIKDQDEEINEMNEALDEMDTKAVTKQKIKPTRIYIKLYEDGTLILSSYDYIDVNKKLLKNYNL